MGNKDDFPTLALVRRLIRTGTLRAVNKSEKPQIRVKRGGKDSDDSDIE